MKKEPSMPEAVIVSYARSPIGRANKGSLVGIRSDDLTAQMVKAALAKVPELDPTQIDDLMLGNGLPGGQQGFNMARVSVLAGWTRWHHREPLLLLVAADHPHGAARSAGEDVHLRRWRPSQLPVHASDHIRTPTTRSSPTRARTAEARGADVDRPA